MGRPSDLRTVKTWITGAGLVVLLTMVAGCSRGGDAPAALGLTEPPVPASLEGFDPDVARAIQKASEEVRRLPEDIPNWKRLGLVYSANEMYDLAAPCFEQLTLLDPADPRGWYHLGLMRTRIGDAEGSIAALEEAGVLSPGYAPAFWQRGFRLLDAGRLNEAETAFGQAARVDPAGLAPVAGLSRVLISRGDLDAAVEMLEGLLARNPRLPYFHHLLGTAYRQQGEAEKAERELTMGAASVPLWPDPWAQERLQYRVGFHAQLDEATRAMNDGRVDLAIPAMERLRGLRPEDRKLLSRIGMAYLRANQQDKAMEALEQMIELHADSFLAHHDMAAALESVGELERALEHAERAIELNPSHARSFTRKASILVRQKKAVEAASVYARAAELAPDDSGILFQLGEARIRLKQWQQAREALERCVRADPYNGKGHVLVGVASLRSGDPERAAEAFDAATRMGVTPSQAVLDELAAARR